VTVTGAASQGQAMSQPLYDPSSKWMLEEQGSSILYVAGERSGDLP
jgi:hypothetical protein